MTQSGSRRIDDPRCRPALGMWKESYLYFEIGHVAIAAPTRDISIRDLPSGSTPDQRVRRRLLQKVIYGFKQL